MKGTERFAWIVACLALLGCLVLGGILWHRDRERDAFTTTKSAELHQAMEQLLQAADSLRDDRARDDSTYVRQMAEFTHLLASLEQVQHDAADHDAEIVRLPSDSLTVRARRLLAECKRLGFLP